MTLLLDAGEGVLRCTQGRLFDPASRTWTAPGAVGPRGLEISAMAAVTWLQSTEHACRVPVGVIGGREARPDQLDAAEALGRALAELGLTILCGGRGGVMEAACRGAASAGGVSVGLLPDDDPAMANAFVTIPIATGLGIARNAVVARAASCLVAVGGGYGTTSEVALGLQFGKAVFTLADGPEMHGARPCDGVDQAVDSVARTILGLPLD